MTFDCQSRQHLAIFLALADKGSFQKRPESSATDGPATTRISSNLVREPAEVLGIAGAIVQIVGGGRKYIERPFQ